MTEAKVLTVSGVPVPRIDAGSLVESVVIKGDLAKLTPTERANYYSTVCKSLGLNPLTKPFEFITLNGKLVLYALRACTDQLRGIHGVSVIEMTDADREGVHIVSVKVVNRDGRTDMARGAVSIGGLKGEALANALMKAETKAKRRATLSICGLGFLDETEIEDIPVTRRENPSVTRPEDVTDVPEADSEDWFPGDPAVKTWAKKDSRTLKDQLVKEMYAIKDIARLRGWKMGGAEKRAKVLPDDWRQILSGLYKAHRESLPIAPEPMQHGDTTIPDAGTDPEGFVRWADRMMAAATTQEWLESGYNEVIEPATKDEHGLPLLFPPDMACVVEMFEKHQRRLAK